MCNTKTEDVKATIGQILELQNAGCDIIRVAVPTMEAAMALTEIKKAIRIPLVADIHFDYRLAIAAIECGADKIRINPGNIGVKERVQAVVDKAREYGVPIRVGVNSGSLEKHLLEEYGGVTAEGIVRSALEKVALIERMGYDNLVISIKSSDVMMWEIDSQARQRVANLMSELLEKNPAPDKMADGMAWTRHMNQIKAQAEELVIQEIIYN